MALKELEARYALPRSRDCKLADGEGLYLFVRTNGSKLWRMKYRYAGREKLLSFGRYPDVSLTVAPAERVELHERDGPHVFDGDAPIRGEPGEGGALALNAMARSGACSAEIRWLHAGDTAQARGAAFLWALQDLPLGGTVLRRLDCAELNGAVELAAALLVTFLPT